MTKRQRVIREEEAPISAPISSEPIRMAEARIKELQKWVELRTQNELKKNEK